MTIACSRIAPRHTLGEPRAATSAERDYDMLDAVRASIGLAIASLVGRWPEAARPDNIVSAIRDLEIARDSVWFEMRELDGGNS